MITILIGRAVIAALILLGIYAAFNFISSASKKGTTQ